MVDGALRLAFNIRVSLKTGQTLAGSCSSSLIANCIDATRRRIARVNDFRSWWFRCNSVASVEGITLVPLVANTDWNMISNPAICIDAAKTRAWILAALVDACKFLRAVRVDHTFRTTVGR